MALADVGAFYGPHSSDMASGKKEAPAAGEPLTSDCRFKSFDSTA
jgi:hypothetical protein